jgi:phosphoglycolate phosphatase
MPSPSLLAPAPAAIVFDLDGTLVDSRRDLAAAVNRTRAAYGLPVLELAEITAMVGEGARNLVARALGRDLSAVDQALERFFGFYREGLLDTTPAYPGVPELLAALAGRRPLAVLTNKPEGFTRRILAGLDLAGRFREVVGGDSLAARKPDPAGLREIARRLGVPAADLLLVGDSRIDAATAAAAGCRFALVTWGFADAAEIAAIRRGDPPPHLVAGDAAALGRGLLGQAG